ncbi:MULTISPECIES: biopolymer transporter ExbD [unclassified Flavobacterium]|uniref:ExbD/TolR family protein n=1 Tax=unclassified Flavobacterium TaxID=196869 RepID=UPI001F12BF3C|nr:MULTISPECIES: biopolymer transporter ExbD [unclassified Flavobacterium]UMY65875.1 biopolymer transporter ExbD [Flavobacterium sp. HJ-32-4]
MAELNTGDGGGGKKGSKKVRSKKSNAKVDLTAMVDLAFLLITFFMLTTSLSKPQSMDLGMPDKNKEDEPKDEIKVADDRTMTILVGGDNKLMAYTGQFDTPLIAPKEYAYGKNGIRKLILQEEERLTRTYGDPKTSKKGIIVIIKPSKKSKYKNIVDILDEMAITKVPTYAIVDIEPKELALLENK